MEELISASRNILFSFIRRPKEVWEKIEKYDLTKNDFKGLNYESKLFDALIKCFNKDKDIITESVILLLKENHGASDAETIKHAFFSLDSENYCNFNHVNSHIKLIKTHSIKTNILQEVQNLQSDIKQHTSDKSISDLYLTLQQRYNEILGYIYDPSSSITSIGSLIDNMKDYFEDQGTLAVKTGYPIYNSTIGGGLRLSSLNLIEGRPGDGKSTLALNIAFFIALSGYPVLILDTELDFRYFCTRLLSLITGIPLNIIETYSKWKDNKPLKDFLHNVMDTIIKKLPLSYKYIGGLSFNHVLCHCKNFVQNQKGVVPVVIYDYLMVNNLSDFAGTRLSETQIIGNVLSLLQDMVVRYEFPMLMFAQTNRAGVDVVSDATTAMSDRFMWKVSSATRLRKPKRETGEYNRILRVVKSRFAMAHDEDIHYKVDFSVMKFEELPQ